MTNEEANIRINKMMEVGKMNKGKVKWFDAGKGFGFIERDNNKDLFVHFQNIKMDGFKTLEEGEAVEFDIASTEKGEQAVNVRRVGK